MGLAQRPMRMDQEDLDLFADCFAANGSPRGVNSLRWQYQDNPVGKLWAELLLAETTGGATKIASIYASLPVRARVRGQSRVAIQSLDTLTDEAHRGNGYFATLATATFARAAADGLAFVYGFPNGKSGPGFFGKLGWSSLDPLPFLIRPLRTRYVARRLRLPAVASWLPEVVLSRRPSAQLPWPRARLVNVEAFDERFTALWRAFSGDIDVTVERDATYLNWRLVAKPENRYRRLAIFEGEQPVAFIAFSQAQKHGGSVGSILELLHLPGKGDRARWLLSMANAELAYQGADVTLAWCLPASRNFSAYLRSGFLPLPESLRPIELHFGVRAFDASIAGLVGNRSAWYISYLDSDTT